MISLNKKVYQILTGCTALTGYTTEIYPLVLEENSKLPCVIFERSTVVGDTNDTHGFGTSSIVITVFSETYNQGIDMCEIIDTAMIAYTDTEIKHTSLNSVDEIYSSPAYIQKLTYTVKHI